MAIYVKTFQNGRPVIVIDTVTIPDASIFGQTFGYCEYVSFSKIPATI